MIHGIIDIGSNTVRLSVFLLDHDRAKNLFNEKVTVGLGGYRENGKLTEKGIRKLVETLKSFKVLTDNFEDIEEIHAFATAGIRNVENTSEILQAVSQQVGWDIELISGDEEARLSFLGASHSLDEMVTGILTDIGGGSTELVFFENGRILDSSSLDIGSLTAYKEYVEELFLTQEERKELDERLKFLLNMERMPREYFSILCAVGGSARGTLKYYNEYYSEHEGNHVMNVDDMKTMLKELMELPTKEKLDRILRVKPDRLHTLLPGMNILYRIAKYYHVPTIAVAQTGIREGYVYDRLLGGQA